MLKQRILTAIILIPIFVLLVFKLPPIGFAFLTGAVVLWGAWEWSAFIGVTKFPQSIIYPIIVLVALFFATFFLNIPTVVKVAAGWWVFALLLVVLYPVLSLGWGRGKIIRGLMGFFVLIPCWLAVNYIRNVDGAGISMLLFLFIIIWGADSGAYFAGKWFGKHKLAPSVSPGKTWEGLFGALLTTVVITVLALWLTDSPSNLWLGGIIVSIVTVLFSILGDLFESMLKRQEGLKDSGHLLPGHGGILDRIDSLTAAAPIFVVGAELLQKFSQ
ncbi:MAG: phosphatidate cytidylyltransferase [Gammaproteobacteria bacterium]